MSSRCKNCLLPHVVPGASIDGEGVCAFCREYAKSDPSIQERERKTYEADLEKALRDCRGKGEYDCLLCFSGGKDSVYLLHRLVKDYGLKVLPYVTNFDIPKIAWENIRRSTEKIGVDCLSYTPPMGFYHKLIRHLLKNQDAGGAVESLCYVWAPLREGDALQLAIEKNIPLVLTGYSPGQPDPERMVYEMPRKLICETDWLPKDLRQTGLFDEWELNQFWNPLKYPKGTVFPRLLSPLHAWPYDQGKLIQKVVDLGLIQNTKHASPIHSNFTLNWLLMYSDLRNLGFNPYVPEFSRLIREGKASKKYWRIMFPVIDFMIRHCVGLGRVTKHSLKWLDLKPEDLVIRHPRKYYQPKI